VPDLKILSKEELLEMEPNISEEAKGALFAKTGGIIDPMLLTISLAENAVANGVECLLNFDVTSIEADGDDYVIASDTDSVTAKYVVNAAGVYADQVHNMAAPKAFEIKLRRGQYFLLDKSEGDIVTRTVFPCPTKVGKGILVVPSIHGNILLGPASDNTLDKDDVATTEDTLYEARTGAKKLIPTVNPWSCIRNFSGLRAESDRDDFIIGEADGAPRFIDVAGIKSPGLTAAPAIATYAVSILEDKGLELKDKENFDPIVKRKLLIEMTREEQDELIKENPLYGRVICRCENITEGDIVDAVHRSPGATTVDGVKRRCRAGMGRCQAGFCGPRVQHIIARELNRPLEEIVLEKSGSYILTGRTK
jgi:glycerol-3-phosphate dehydrogenase